MYKMQMIQQIMEETLQRLENLTPRVSPVVDIEQVVRLEAYLSLQKELATNTELQKIYVSFIIFA